MEVTVESIAAGGDGIARAEGLVVFVPRSAPGDSGTVVVAPRGSFARAEFTDLRRPGPHRVSAPCPHYTADRCGGCQLQHLEYGAQLQAKSGIVRDALKRIGGRIVDAPDVRASPEEWRYRRKLTLALRRRGDWWVAGLHPYDDPARIFPVDDCPITHERVIFAWREVLAAAADLPNVNKLRGAVRVSGELSFFILEGGRSWPRSKAFFDHAPSLAAIWWRASGRKRVLLHARSDKEDSAAGASFSQINPGVASLLHTYVVERALQHGPRTVIDAYSGLGDIAHALVERGALVNAIELDSEAAGWCRKRLPAGSSVVTGRVEQVIAGLLPQDVVILNPPRAGVDAGVTDALSRCEPPPRAIIYVSCNPATLARDVRRMPGFRIASVQAFDMFPQTAHVETVCELVPEGA